MRPSCGMASTHGRLAAARRSTSLQGGRADGQAGGGAQASAGPGRRERALSTGGGLAGVSKARAARGCHHSTRLLARPARPPPSPGAPAVLALLAAVAEQHGAAGRVGQQRRHVIRHCALQGGDPGGGGGGCQGSTEAWQWGVSQGWVPGEGDGGWGGRAGQTQSRRMLSVSPAPQQQHSYDLQPRTHLPVLPPPQARTVRASTGARLSTTSRRRSHALALRAHCSPSRRTRLGSECSWERCTGPCTTPPPRLQGTAACRCEACCEACYEAREGGA